MFRKTLETEKIGQQSCDQCDYKTKSKKTLLKHVKSRHEGVKFPCDLWDYKAHHKSYLLTHLKSVHDGFRFPCDQSNYKARQNKHLIMHIKSVHKGVRFPCDQCVYKARQDSRFYYTFNKHIMFMCMLLLNTYSSLAFSLGWDMKRIGVKTITDGSRARHVRPSLGVNRSVIDKPSSILVKHTNRVGA